MPWEVETWAGTHGVGWHEGFEASFLLLFYFFPVFRNRIHPVKFISTSFLPSVVSHTTWLWGSCCSSWVSLVDGKQFLLAHDGRRCWSSVFYPGRSLEFLLFPSSWKSARQRSVSAAPRVDRWKLPFCCSAALGILGPQHGDPLVSMRSSGHLRSPPGARWLLLPSFPLGALAPGPAAPPPRAAAPRQGDYEDVSRSGGRREGSRAPDEVLGEPRRVIHVRPCVCV